MRRPAPTVTLGRHTVGNALVLHARERISSEAQALALAVAEDADNDIVILDLHDDLPVGIWEAVATALPRRRRGIRLLVCGAGQDVATLTGQWLSDRLARAVVVPYGKVIRAAAGALFVHAEGESGWVRHVPGRGPAWDGKRYPRPAWDDAAADYLPTSAHGVVEPLPGGVWIRDTRDEAAIAEHWQWLTSAVPCQPRAFTVVLGCPGTPPLALDDVARFWHGLPEEGRSRARFVHYGPVRVPEGEAVGQALADLLETPVVCFTGVPVGRPERPRMHTVAPDGRLGWQVYARELGYRPRTGQGVAAEPPRILSYRAPMVLGEAVAPMIYRYADDAVVEIVQSGLWMRPPVEPRHADRIRARAADPAGHAVVVDDAAPALVPRLRELADDLVARLDEATRERSALQLASAVVATGSRVSQPAGGALTEGLTYRFTAADLLLDEPIEEVAPAAETAGLVVAAPVTLGASRPGRAAGSLAPAGSPEPVAELPRSVAALLQIPDVPSPPAAVVLAPSPPAVVPAPSQPAPLLPAPPQPVVGSSGPSQPTVAPPVPSRFLVTPPAASSPSAVSVPATTGAVPGAGVPLGTDMPPGTHMPPVTGVSPAPGVPQPAGSGDLRFQEPPAPADRGVPGPDGLTAEREWLRNTLTREYDAAASSVSRILAGHPGFHAGPDTMTDAIAVRLYLSPVGRGLDEALRTGEGGPQVPFARCVASGLGRLPSHRGIALVRADLSPADLRAITERGVLTDWGFTNALTEPAEGLAGTVDVLIWSMTGRRTRLLELDDGTGVATRVVFRPGTSFKVLESAAPDGDRRGHLLLRELPADEPDRGRVPFDDLALTSLHRASEQWAVAGPALGSLDAVQAARFTLVPGVR